MTKRPKIRKKSRRPKKRGIIRRILLVAVVLFVAAAATLAVYMVYLSHRIDQRFAGRIWDIPSKVYSDTTLLYVGQKISRTLLTEKLKALGYRETDSIPGRQGEMSVTSHEITLWLHDFNSPIYNQESLQVRIRLSENQLTDITDLDSGKSLAIVELEPEELMLYYGPDRERRQRLHIRKLPPHVVHAVLAAEDHDFYEHQGFVLKGYLRAFIANLRSGDIGQGGSTITLQVAKNYFLTLEQTYRRKIQELVIAVVLEFKFSKTDILEMYLNEVYWGHRGSVAMHGLTEAARYYFDKEASELSVAEAATLAGVLRSPGRYSPIRHPEASLRTRNIVINDMYEEGWLREDQLEAALAESLTPAGYSPQGRRAPYFMDYLTNQLTELYSRGTLTTEGLSIFTTIDTQVQSAAETALERGLSQLEASRPELMRDDAERRLQGAVIVLQPKTGYILAMVGGRNYGVSQYNRAANAMRQPGSAFKPFVYLSALDRFTPASKLSNAPGTYMIDGNPWEPKNFEASAPEQLTFREALVESQNIATVNLAFSDTLEDAPSTVAVNLATAPGLKRMSDIAKDFHLYLSGHAYPSMVLGAREVTPLTLARAYCAFAADGVLPFPLSIKDVANEAGDVVESRHARIEGLISPAKAYMMSDLMRSAVEMGTGRSLKYRGIDWPVAGKTGTTNDSRDAWFVGYTPDILALVWVGFDNGESLHTTGAGAALPIWADLMTSLPQYVSGEWFPAPPGIETHVICKGTGLLANTGCCPDTTEELFLSGTAPAETCTEHVCAPLLHDFMEGVKKIVPGL